MSKTGWALLARLLITLVVTAIAFGAVVKNEFRGILTLSVIAAVIDYLAGDLLILPKVGSLVGALIDGVLAVLIAMAYARIIPTFTTTTAALATYGVLVAIGEFFFHMYLMTEDKVAP